jgi:hypothetical protein
MHATFLLHADEIRVATMKRVSISYLVRVALLLICNESLAFQHDANLITPSSGVMSLRHWRIAEDPSPGSVFHFPADSLWQPLHPNVGNKGSDQGNWLIGTDILITDSLNMQTPWGLFLSSLSTAYDVYWDGSRIAQNGIVGITDASEIPGSFNVNLVIPSHLMTVGKHTIVLRLSHHHAYSSWKWLYGDCAIGPYDAGLKNAFQSRYKTFFIIGILAIPFVINLFLYGARQRRTEHLLFALICLVVILDSVTSLVPAFADVSTTYIHWEVYAYQTFTLLFATLFPAFFVRVFSFPGKIMGGVLAVNVIIYLFFTNLASVFDILSLTVLVISSLIAAVAVQKRREGSIIIAIGLVAAWAAYYFGLAFDGMATVMVLCTSISIARQFVRKERAEKEAQLRSAQLETELLRKHINPHFLLNTLTSVIVYLRKDAASAIGLVEALADEFRMIMKISSLRQIPMKQEIELCRAHLTIMSYRKGGEYTLETVDCVEEENVPPMVFHTLIENGLTHGFETRMKGTFVLLRRSTPGSIQYVLTNNGEVGSDESRESTGVGLRYVKSRLEESYPNRWSIRSQQQAQGWETIIEIRNR